MDAALELASLDGHVSLDCMAARGTNLNTTDFGVIPQEDINSPAFKEGRAVWSPLYGQHEPPLDLSSDISPMNPLNGGNKDCTGPRAFGSPRVSLSRSTRRDDATAIGGVAPGECEEPPLQRNALSSPTHDMLCDH